MRSAALNNARSMMFGCGTLALATALLWPAAAMAQAPGQGEFEADHRAAQDNQEPVSVNEQEPQPDNEEVVVTGTRLDAGGFDAPTPTTVIGATELRQGARSTVAAVLNDQPQFRATSTPTTTIGNLDSSTSTADLRGLGDIRTLTLLNGRRTLTAGDLNNVPMGLVKRVEIVTGGASAAWGSGAVAGVVNIQLNDKLEGLTVGADVGVSSRGDGERYGLNASFGTAFASGRGHFIAGVQYVDDKGVFDRHSRPNLTADLFASPGVPGEFILARDVNWALVSEGGLILSGILAGQTFNSDGTLRPFQFGDPVGGFTMIGGEGTTLYDYLPVSAPSERLNVYARSSFDVTDTVNLWVDASYSRISAEQVFFPEPDPGSIVVSSENPFLSADIRAALAGAGETEFVLGRFHADFGLLTYDYERETKEVAVGVDGELGRGWRVSAHYAHGEKDIEDALKNSKISANFANAIDVVTDPGTGQPVCRIALTTPDTACRPLNIFGFGNASADAVNYAFGTPSSDTKIKLDTGGISLRGDLFKLWGRPVAVAIGAEARRESLKSTNDPLSAAGAFAILNYGTLKGDFSVKEGFAEILLPLLDIPGKAKLDLNGAIRYSDYSTSGGIWSWKLGATQRLFDDLLLRVVRSRDIRSPSIPELFTTQSTNISTIADPFTGTTASVFLFGGGNPDLKPEVAKTWTIGGSYSPSAVPGLRVSADYYAIKIDEVIASLSAQDIVDQCFAGDQTLCDAIVRENGVITSVSATYLNLASYETQGLDFEAAYRLPLSSIVARAPGAIRFRLLANYVDKLVIDNRLTKIDRVGDVGDQVTFGVPKWRATGGLTYESGDFAVDARVRYVGGGVFDSQTNIANNKIASRTYFDLGAQYTRSGFTLFGSVNNLFDRDPPLIVYGSPHYDTVGRYFSGGVKVAF